MDLVLIKLMDMCFNEMFSDPHCSYIYCLQVDLVLIKLMDMCSNEMFSDPHCSYILPTDGSGFN